MKAKTKLRDGLEERINIRVQKMKAREGYYFLISNIGYTEKSKQRNKYQITKATEKLELLMPKIKKFVKNIKVYVPHIWEQTPITAAYLLIGKTYGNLETIITL